MDERLAALTEKRETLLGEAKDLSNHDDFDSQESDGYSDRREKFTNIMSDVEVINGQIKDREQLIALNPEPDRPGAKGTIEDTASTLDISEDEATQMKADVDAWFGCLLQSDNSVDFQARVNAAVPDTRLLENAINSDPNLPAFQNAMSTQGATGTGSGGDVVPVLVAAEILNRMRYYGGPREAASINSVPYFPRLEFPISDNTTERAHRPAEGAKPSGGGYTEDKNLNTGKVTFVSQRLQTDTVRLTEELLAAAPVLMANWAMNELSVFLFREETQYLSEILLAPNASTDRIGRAGALGAGFGVEDFLGLPFRLDPMYRNPPSNVVIQMHDTVLTPFRTATVQDDRRDPVRLFSTVNIDGVMKTVDIGGHLVVINQEYPTNSQITHAAGAASTRVKALTVTSKDNGFIIYDFTNMPMRVQTFMDYQFAVEGERALMGMQWIAAGLGRPGGHVVVETTNV